MKLQFIVNPLSGGTDKSAFLALAHKDCERAGASLDIVYTRHPGHATQIAKESDADVVVAVGGDGTVNEVATGIFGTDRVLGIIPFGSGNGLARHLGIDTNPEKALGTLLEMHETRIDCGFMNDRLFLCTCGVGLDAAVSMRFAQYPERGLKTYVKSAILEWEKHKPEDYIISIEDRELHVKASMITVGNANQWGYNAFVLPKASVTDGMLDIAIVAPLHVDRIPGLAIRLMTKHLKDSSNFNYLKGRDISIIRSSEGAVHVDGEPIMQGKTLQIHVVPEAIRVVSGKSEI